MAQFFCSCCDEELDASDIEGSRCAVCGSTVAQVPGAGASAGAAGSPAPPPAAARPVAAARASPGDAGPAGPAVAAPLEALEVAIAAALRNNMLMAENDPLTPSTGGSDGASEAALARLVRQTVGEEHSRVLRRVRATFQRADRSGETLACEVLPAAFGGRVEAMGPVPLQPMEPLDGAGASAAPTPRAAEGGQALLAIRRGKRSFSEMGRMAQAAGFRGVIVLNSGDVWPFTMRNGAAQEERARGMADVRVPMAMVRKEEGKTIAGWLAGAGGGAATCALEICEGEGHCAVCYEPYEEGQCTVTLPCSHDFHEACVLRWLRQRANCPLYRTPIAPGRQGADGDAADGAAQLLYTD